MEPIQDMAGVAAPSLYRCLVSVGAVGHDDLYPFAPLVPLSGQTTAQRRRVDRHLPSVAHQPTRQARGEAALERRMVLAEPSVAARLAGHAALLEHQRVRPTRHPHIADLAVPTVMGLAAGCPAVGTLGAPHRRCRRHH